MLEDTIREVETWVRDLTSAQLYHAPELPGQTTDTKLALCKLMWITHALGSLHVAESALKQAQEMLKGCEDLIEKADREPAEVGE